MQKNYIFIFNLFTVDVNFNDILQRKKIYLSSFTTYRLILIVCVRFDMNSEQASTHNCYKLY